MRKAFTPEGIQFGWDSTSIGVAQECLYKYKLSIIEGWQPRKKSVHLDFGGWYASALESFHKYRADGMEYADAVREVVSEALVETWVYPSCGACGGAGRFENDDTAACIACAGEGFTPEGGEPWKSDHNTKTRENLIRTIIWYLEEFKDDPCATVILSTGKPAVEHSFRLEADNDIVLCGHLDRLVNYSDNLYITDNKTTGSTLGPYYFEQYSPNTQMSLYTFAGKAIFNLPVKGVIIDAAQIAVGFSKFQRGFAFRDEPQLTEFYDMALYRIQEAQQATKDDYFPMNPGSCHNYGGCEFRSVCARSPVVRKQFLKGDFVQRAKLWDPLEAR